MNDEPNKHLVEILSICHAFPLSLRVLCICVLTITFEESVPVTVTDFFRITAPPGDALATSRTYVPDAVSSTQGQHP